MHARNLLTVTALLAALLPPAVLATVTNITSGGPRYTTITAALAAALAGDTLLISTGTYNESPDINKNVRLLGGYDGAFANQIGMSLVTNGGTAGSVIDITGGAHAYLDALSLRGGNEAVYFGGGLDVRSGSTAIVVNCALTQCRGLRGGALYASGAGTLVILSNTPVSTSFSTGEGGGLSANSGAIVIAAGANTDINNNYAPAGGGVHVNNARVELVDDADLYANTTSGDGAGALVEGGATFVARDAFTTVGYNAANANRATNGNGGGIYAINARVEVCNQTFVTGNEAAQFGGGIYLSNSTLLADNAYVGYDFPTSTNTATIGGGIFGMYSHVLLTNGSQVIRGAASDGGGVYMLGGQLDAVDVQIGVTDPALANTADNGGGFYLNSTTTRFCNVVVQENRAVNVGGGGIFSGSGALTLTNVTFLRNTAAQVGGLYATAFDPAAFVATHIISNTAVQYGGLLAQFGSPFSIAHSSLRDNAAVMVGGGYLFTIATGLVHATAICGNVATNDIGGLYLSGGKTTFTDCRICDNTADSLDVGNGVGGGLYCVGAQVEFRADAQPAVISGNRAALGAGVGMDSASAATFIALDTATPVVISHNIARADGGGLMLWSATTASLYGAVLIISNTALTGGGVYLTNMASLVILPTNGFAAQIADNLARGSGGGIAILGPDAAADTLNARISGNRAHGTGGGMPGGGGVFVRGGAFARLHNAWIVGNLASNIGGGVLATDKSELLVDSDFSNAPPALVPPSQVVGNHAGYQVGGLYVCIGGRGVVKNAMIVSNTAVDAAGGFAALSATAQLVNTIIAHNTGGTLVDGLALQASLLATIQECTIVDNNSNGYWSSNFSPPVLENNIVWGHSVSQIFDSSLASVVNFCDVQGGYPGFFNITNEPDFVNRAALDFQLQPASPCIDKGATLITVLNDCIGNPRPYDGGWDMGAYEFVPEPAGLGLLLCAAALLRRRRR